MSKWVTSHQFATVGPMPAFRESVGSSVATYLPRGDRSKRGGYGPIPTKVHRSNKALFDYLIGNQQKIARNFKIKRFRSL
jgi:hypothetical protein